MGGGGGGGGGLSERRRGGSEDRRSGQKLQKCDSRAALESLVHGEDATAARGVTARLLPASTRRIKMVGRRAGDAAALRLCSSVIFQVFRSLSLCLCARVRACESVRPCLIFSDSVRLSRPSKLATLAPRLRDAHTRTYARSHVSFGSFVYFVSEVCNLSVDTLAAAAAKPREEPRCLRWPRWLQRRS